MRVGKYTVGAALVFGVVSSALAQEPLFARPVRIVVPFSAGSGLDAVARSYAAALAEQTRGTFVVENKEGAGGVIGSLEVSRAAPDGRTLLFTAHAPFATTPYMRSKGTYDPVNDFVPVTKVAVTPMVLLAASTSTFKSFDDLVSQSRSQPGKLSYATSGIGAPSHLHMEVVKQALALDIAPIHYKSSGQPMTDLIGGRLDFYMPSLPAALSFIQSGQVKPLAVGSATRSSLMPGVPTLAEALRQPGLEAVVWYGFLAPKGTPVELANRLHSEIVKASTAPGVVDVLAKTGAQATLVPPAAFLEQVRTDAAKSQQLLRVLNVKPE